MRAGDVDFVLADIPGLIAGAHEGAGLGDRFLGHVERCRVVLHLIDVTDEDPVSAYRTVRSELAAYGAGLAEKPEIVALSKSDAVPDEVWRARAAALREADGIEAYRISAHAGTGVANVLHELARLIETARSGRLAMEAEAGWTP